MSSPSVIAVAGPCGSGKTTWINQFFKDETAPFYYFYPDLDRSSVDLTWIIHEDQQKTSQVLNG